MTRKPRAGTKQVYVHVLNTVKGPKEFRRVTFLASATASGTPGNGDSYDPSMAPQFGRKLSFTSTSTNLAGGDRNGVSDVFERLMMPKLLRFPLRLVSAAGRSSGNGPSASSWINGDGDIVAFQTLANNIAPGDSDGNWDIIRRRFDRNDTRMVSGPSTSAAGGADATNPSMSMSGEFVFFETPTMAAVPQQVIDPTAGAVAPVTVLKFFDELIPNVLLWTEKRNKNEVFSLNGQNKPVTLDARRPATSARGNYMLFETADPSADAAQAKLLARYGFTDPAALRVYGKQSALAAQVYMRYLGPK